MIKQLLGTAEDLRCGLFNIEERLPFNIGQLIMLNMYDLTDKYFFSKERIEKENLSEEDVDKRIEESKILVPGLITSVVLGRDMLPLANVMIFSRWNSGEISGGIEITEMCVWRYINYDAPIPNWILESVKQSAKETDEAIATFFGVPISKIFYLQREEGKYYAIYPFKDA